MGRTALAFLAIFVAWSLVDFVLHGLLLGPTYEATAALWRPAEAMSTSLIWVVTSALIACFLALWSWLVEPKTAASGLVLGALYGLVTGLAAGVGPWLHMPIPGGLAAAWFVGALAKGLLAGAIVGPLWAERRGDA